MRNCNCRRCCNQYSNCRCQNRNLDYFNMYSRNNSNCGCMNHNDNHSHCCMNNNDNNNSNAFPCNYLYGHAYTPNQTLNELFDPQTGLDNGSMYPELVSPYYPGQSIEFIEYLKTTGRNGGCDCE